MMFAILRFFETNAEFARKRLKPEDWNLNENLSFIMTRLGILTTWPVIWARVRQVTCIALFISGQTACRDYCAPTCDCIPYTLSVHSLPLLEVTTRRAEHISEIGQKRWRGHYDTQLIIYKNKNC